MKNLNKNISLKALEFTCEIGVQDIIDFFIGHDDDLLIDFKENVHLVDKVKHIDKLLSPEETIAYFINLRADLIAEGYTFKSGPFIYDWEEPSMKCMRGVKVYINKDISEEENRPFLKFGLNSLIKKSITEVIRFK